MAKKNCAKCGKKLGFLDIVEKLESGEEVCANCYREQRLIAAREEMNAEKKLKERYLELRNQGATEQDASQQLGLTQEKTSLLEEEHHQKQRDAIILTTSFYIEDKHIVEYKDIISAEAVMGVNIFRDMFSEVRDVIGGRSASYQKELKKGKNLVLDELRREAYELGANAVISVDLDYNQLTGRNLSSLMVVATGTAVVVE